MLGLRTQISRHFQGLLFFLDSSSLSLYLLPLASLLLPVCISLLLNKGRGRGKPLPLPLNQEIIRPHRTASLQMRWIPKWRHYYLIRNWRAEVSENEKKEVNPWLGPSSIFFRPGLSKPQALGPNWTCRPCAKNRFDILAGLGKN